MKCDYKISHSNSPPSQVNWCVEQNLTLAIKINCTVYLKKTLVLQVPNCFIVDANKDDKSTLDSTGVWACCWYKQHHKSTLNSTCLAVGIALKINDFSAIPIYGSTCYVGQQYHYWWISRQKHSFVKKNNPAKNKNMTGRITICTVIESS